MQTSRPVELNFLFYIPLLQAQPWSIPPLQKSQKSAAISHCLL